VRRRFSAYLVAGALMLVAGCTDDGPAWSQAVIVDAPAAASTTTSDVDASPGAAGVDPEPAIPVPASSETPGVDVATQDLGVLLGSATSLPDSLPPVDVAVVGDSLTLAAQTDIESTLSALGLGVVAVDGQESRRMTHRTDTIRSGLDAIAQIRNVSPPSVWVIALGTNDVGAGSSNDSIRRNVRSVLAAIPPDASVVWVDVFIRDRRREVERANTIISEEVLARPGTVVAEFFSHGDDDGIVGGDGVHLTRAGRRLFAEVMAGGITSVLATSSL
jgi:lysophospholipase L1-like esterase